MSVGALSVEVQVNAARTQEDMGKVVSVIETGARRINASAAEAEGKISRIARAGRSLGRVQGAEEAAKSIEKIGHSSTGARREILVLAHELSQGNFKKAAGSLMVLGERMDWMGKIMSPMGLAIGALAVTVGAFAVAAYVAAERTAQFNRTLTLTGGYAGLTLGGFEKLTKGVAEASNTTTHSAREITEALMQTGRFGGEALAHVAAAAAAYAALSGQKSEEVVKNFEKMAEGPLKFALELNKQTHFMTGALYDQISALEDAGKKQEAMIVISDASVAAYNRQTSALKDAGGAMQSFKNWISGVSDEFVRFMNASPSIEQRIGEIKDAIARAPKQGGLLAQGVHQSAQAPNLYAQLGALTSQQRRQQLDADLKADKAATDEKVVEAKASWKAQMEAHKEGIAARDRDIAKARETGALAGAPQAEIDKEVARIRKSYEHAGAGGVQRADTAAALKPLEDQVKAEEKLLSYRERVLAQYNKADLLSTEGYYDTRATVINAENTRVQALYDAQIAVAENQVKRSTDARAKIEATMKVGELRDAKEAAALATGEALAQNDFEKAQATQAYKDEVTKLIVELDKLRQTQTNSALDNFDRANRPLKERATANGDTGTLDNLAQLRAATDAESRMNELKEKSKIIEDGLTRAENQNQLLVQTGQRTEVEGMEKVGEARTAAAQQLEVIAEQMQAIAQNSGMPALIAQADDFKLKVDQIQASSTVLGKTVSDVFASNFNRSLLAVENRTKTLKQAFLDMANGIEQALLQIVNNDIAQMLFNNGTGAAGSGGGSGTGGLFAKLVGLAISAYGGGATGSEAAGASDTSTPDDLISGYSGRASGGPVAAGGAYQVNERGPELLTVANRTFLMMGDQPGKVTPLGSGNGGNTFHLNIAVPPGTTRQTAQQQAREIMAQAQIAQARNG